MTPTFSEQRQRIVHILQQVHAENYPQQKQNELMQALGFQSDVPFAKSLFSDTLALRYKDCNGDFEIFVASDQVAKISLQGRQLFIKIVRIFHQQKTAQNMKSKNGGDKQMGQVTFPNPNNVQEIIAFQKSMYEMVKHFQPFKAPSTSYQPSPMPQMKNFSPFPMNPEPINRQVDYEYFPPIQSPYIPSFGSNSLASNHYSNNSSKNQAILSVNKSNPFLERNMFIKAKTESFVSVDSMKEHNNQIFYSLKDEEEKRIKGFANFIEEEEQPSTKLKTEVISASRISHLESMKQELKKYKCEEASREKLFLPQKDGYDFIKKSVSEYLQEGEGPEPRFKKPSQQ